MVHLVRSELEAAGVKEEAREKLVAGLQNTILKAEKKEERSAKEAPTLIAPGRNQMVSSKLAVKVSEGAAMRYVVATDDIKAGEVGNKLLTRFSSKSFQISGGGGGDADCSRAYAKPPPIPLLNLPQAGHCRQ